MSQKATKVLRE